MRRRHHSNGIRATLRRFGRGFARMNADQDGRELQISFLSLTFVFNLIRENPRSSAAYFFAHTYESS
jgi:hypothetical protein